jgi:predicted glutamine amidotransferase
MCRLLAYSAREKTTLPSFIGKDFSKFLELSNVHHDSWGLAIDDGTQTELLKAAETAINSQTFSDEVNSRSGTGALLHFRWASPGLPVSDENAHPFTHDDISFIHNGALSPYDALQDLVSAELLEQRTGQTDTELFFLYLLTEIRKSDFLTGVLNVINNVKTNFDYSSINSMIMNPDYLVVVSEHNPDNKPTWADEYYYELRYRSDENGFAVASSGWPQEGWSLIPNHRILIIDRKTSQIQVIDL